MDIDYPQYYDFMEMYLLFLESITILTILKYHIFKKIAYYFEGI